MALPVHSTTRYQSHHSASHETALLDGLCEVRRGHGSLPPAAPSSRSRRAHISLPPAAFTDHSASHETALLDGLCEVRRGHGSLLPAAPSSSSRRAHVSLPPAALTTQPTMTALLDAGSRIGGMALCNGGEVGHGFMQWGRGGTWLYAMGERWDMALCNGGEAGTEWLFTC